MLALHFSGIIFFCVNSLRKSICAFDLLWSALTAVRKSYVSTHYSNND
ncbi:MAG: hypothetical protein ACI9V1_000719 [Spirosomataceae bacterium]|jgi:hypothetical protein